MSFLEEVEECFGNRELYAVLGVDRSAGQGELKKAYYRLSLKVHPDRARDEDETESTKKFQTLGKIYAVLTDKQRRALYDEEGVVEEDDSSILRDQHRDWMEYWRLLFKEVTLEDIKSFESSFKGGEEEREALRAAYLKCHGDMDGILDEVLCTRIDDEPRFRDIIAGWIQDELVPAFPAFTDEPAKKRKARKRRYEREAKEAEEARPTGGEDIESLKSLILARKNSREAQMDGFFDSLEEKYAKKPRKGGSKKEQNGGSKGAAGGSARSKGAGGRSSRAKKGGV